MLDINILGHLPVPLAISKLIMVNIPINTHFRRLLIAMVNPTIKLGLDVGVYAYTLSVVVSIHIGLSCPETSYILCGVPCGARLGPMV